MLTTIINFSIIGAYFGALLERAGLLTEEEETRRFTNEFFSRKEVRALMPNTEHTDDELEFIAVELIRRFMHIDVIPHLEGARREVLSMKGELLNGAENLHKLYLRQIN